MLAPLVLLRGQNLKFQRTQLGHAVFHLFHIGLIRSRNDDFNSVTADAPHCDLFSTGRIHSTDDGSHHVVHRPFEILLGVDVIAIDLIDEVRATREVDPQAEAVSNLLTL